jgi:hypothetical protein
MAVATFGMNRAPAVTRASSPTRPSVPGAAVARLKPRLWPAAHAPARVNGTLENETGHLRADVFPMVVAFGAESFQG